MSIFSLIGFSGGKGRAILVLAVTVLIAPPTLAGPITFKPDSVGIAPPELVNLPTLSLEDSGSRKGEPDGRQDRDRKRCKIAGCSLFVSGILLCSWGISSWEVEEYQCCPARNTDNVIKIVAGVLLINAGLIYLMTDCE